MKVKISGIYKGQDPRGTIVGGKSFPIGVVRSDVVVTTETLKNLVLGEEAGWFSVQECSEPDVLKEIRDSLKEVVYDKEPEAKEEAEVEEKEVVCDKEPEAKEEAEVEEKEEKKPAPKKKAAKKDEDEE